MILEMQLYDKIFKNFVKQFLHVLLNVFSMSKVCNLQNSKNYWVFQGNFKTFAVS
mgnify:CR=1 FL=1